MHDFPANATGIIVGAGVVFPALALGAIGVGVFTRGIASGTRFEDETVGAGGTDRAQGAAIPPSRPAIISREVAEVSRAVDKRTRGEGEHVNLAKSRLEVC